MKILVAGMGNVLQRDDGFGVAVAGALAERPLPAAVTVIEIGTGGIHLVQTLLEGFDALIVADAVHRDAKPGTVFVLEPRVPGLDEFTPDDRHEMLVDMHYTVPSRALILAKALDSLPRRVWIVGCQPLEAEALGVGLSDIVAAAVPIAVDRIETLIRSVAAGGPPEFDPSGAANGRT